MRFNEHNNEIVQIYIIKGYGPKAYELEQYILKQIATENIMIII